MHSSKLFAITIIASLLIINDIGHARHIYGRYRRSIERESDVPSKESTVIAQGDNAEDVHRTVKDFSNEIATEEKDGKDFFEFDYNPKKDLFKFSGHMPQLFAGSHHLQMFEQMMQQMLAHTQSMFKNFPMTNFNNYPENYNGTTESEITIGGRRFRKKERIINQSGEGTQLSIVSTIYEPIDDEDITTVSPNKDGVTEGSVISY